MQSFPSLKFPASAIPSDFHKRLVRERQDRGWSQARLAREAGLERATVMRLEADKRRPMPDTVFRLEAALDLLPQTLVPDWPEWNPIGLYTYGARSRERRRELDLSLEKVAAEANVSIATLSRFESARGTTPSLLERGKPDRAGNASTRPIPALSKALGFESVEAHVRFCLDY